MANLMLHTGSKTVAREQLAAVVTPQRTPTWVPIPHERFVSGIIDSLQQNHMTVVGQSHGLSTDGARYFGLLEVTNGKDDGDIKTIVGLRNSHDKSFPAGLVIGASVMVCDNLSFSGEIKLARKHTAHIDRDLPQLIHRAIGQLNDHRGKQALRFASYQETEFTDAEAHDLIIRAVDSLVCPVTKLPAVLQEWRNPRYHEFRANGKTAWRLFNAFTESLKNGLDLLPKRTQALHGLMDMACKIDGQSVPSSAVTMSMPV
jgi:Domain of unknown function (DUF932)